MINFSQKFGQAAFLVSLSLALAFVPTGIALANDTAEEIRISSPLFQIDEIWPEREITPSIEPPSGKVQSTQLTTVRRYTETQTVLPKKYLLFLCLLCALTKICALLGATELEKTATIPTFSVLSTMLGLTKM